MIAGNKGEHDRARLKQIRDVAEREDGTCWLDWVQKIVVTLALLVVFGLGSVRLLWGGISSAIHYGSFTSEAISDIFFWVLFPPLCDWSFMALLEALTEFPE